jgi:L-fuconolactonase
MYSRLIDTHTHFWDLNNQINSWVVNSGNEYLMQNHGFETYANDVYGVVIVEAADGQHSLQESKWLEDTCLVNNHATAIRHIAHINMLQDQDDFLHQLEKFATYPFVVGFRHILAYDNEVSYSPCIADVTKGGPALANLVQNLVTLRNKGYLFNCQMYPNQLLRMEEILLDTRVSCAIDHCALPVYADEKKRNDWLAVLKIYGESDISFKISGFDMNNNKDNFAAIMDHMFENIEPAKLVFGSNYPLSGSIDSVNQLKDYLQQNNLDQYTEQIFFSNAYKLYRF